MVAHRHAFVSLTLLITASAHAQEAPATAPAEKVDAAAPVAPKAPEAKEHKDAKWYDKLSGARLGTLVSLPPGLVMLVMGAIRQDYSTILMAAVPVLGGVGLWLYAESLAKRPKPNSPSPTVSAKSPSFEAA